MSDWIFAEFLPTSSVSLWRGLAEGWLARPRSPLVRSQYRRLLNLFLAWFGRDPALATPTDGQAWESWLQAENYMPNTIRGYLIAVSSFYTYASLHAPDLALANPARCLLHDRQADPSHQPITELDVEAVLAVIDLDYPLGLRDAALILFLLDSGWPAPHALRLRWGDFHVSRRGVSARRPGPSPRLVSPLDWQTWAAIADSLQSIGRLAGIRSSSYVFTPLIDVSLHLQRHFGPAWTEKPLTYVALTRRLALHAQRAGLPPGRFTANNLRRLAALRRWQSGFSLSQLQAFLGHHRIQSTRDFLARAGQPAGHTQELPP